MLRGTLLRYLRSGIGVYKTENAIQYWGGNTLSFNERVIQFHEKKEVQMIKHLQFKKSYIILNNNS